MGLTKQYLAYRPFGYCNIITGARSNIQFVSLKNKNGRFVAVGAAESVIVWDMR